MKSKKISKVILSKDEFDQLNLLEQGSLLGGSYGADNTNSTHACTCYYDNTPSLVNSNEAIQCACHCSPR